MSNQNYPNISCSFHDLLPVMAWLDRILVQAVAQAQLAYGEEAATNPYRGLYIQQDDITHAFEQEVGASPFKPREENWEELFFQELSKANSLMKLHQLFHLGLFDIAVLIIALAPEIDLRYEQIYAYLQNDITRKRPSIDLSLNLLCTSASDKLLRLTHFLPDALLIHQGALQLITDPSQHRPPLLAHYLKLDEQIIRWLLGYQEIDLQLRHFCKFVKSDLPLDKLPLDVSLRQGLEVLTVEAWSRQQPLILYFHGPRGVGKQRTAATIAFRLGVSLLSVDLVALLELKLNFHTSLGLLRREVLLQSPILYLTGCDELLDRGQDNLYQQLLEFVAQNQGITIIAGKKLLQSEQSRHLNAIAVEFSLPDFAQRRTYWQANLKNKGIKLDEDQLNNLSDRYRLTPAQIEGIIDIACNQSRWINATDGNTVSDPKPSLNELFAAARMQSGQDLTTVARKILSKHTWDSIILPSNLLMQLREMSFCR